MSELATLNKSISFLAAFAVVGALLAMAFLLVENQGKLQESALKVRKRATAFAGIWFAATSAVTGIRARRPRNTA